MRCSEGAGGLPPQMRPFLPALPPIGRVAALLDFYPYPQILFLYLDGYHAFPEGRTYADASAYCDLFDSPQGLVAMPHVRPDLLRLAENMYRAYRVLGHLLGKGVRPFCQLVHCFHN